MARILLAAVFLLTTAAFAGEREQRDIRPVPPEVVSLEQQIPVAAPVGLQVGPAVSQAVVTNTQVFQSSITATPHQIGAIVGSSVGSIGSIGQTLPVVGAPAVPGVARGGLLRSR